MRYHLSRLMGRLSVGRKLALIYLLDLTAVIFISAILINEKYIAINFADKEVVGNHYIGALRDVLLSLNDDTDVPATRLSETDRRQMAKTLREAEQKFGADMGSKKLSDDLLAALAPAKTAAPPSRSRQVENDVKAFALGRELVTRIGNQSNLILDPDLDSYYVMSLILLRFPEVLEIIGSTSRLAQELAKTPPNERAALETKFIILEGRLNGTVNGAISDYNEAYQASTPILRARLAGSQAALQKSLDTFSNASKIYAGLSPGKVSTEEFAARDDAAMASLHLAWTESAAELERLLQVRIDGAYERMWTHLGTAALLLAIILSMVFFVARQIAIPLRNLARITGEVRQTGDYSLRANWESTDEIGRLVKGFNGMLQQLDQQRISQQELVATASAAQAQRELVEGIPIPLMVTSIPRHQVLHANHAAHAWLDGRTDDPWVRGMEPSARAHFFQRLSDLGTVDEFEVHWKGGAQPSWALVSARRIDFQGQAAVLTTFTPINRMKQMESGLELWAKVFEASSESIIVMDAGGRIVTINRAFSRSTAYEIHEMTGERPDFLLAERNDQVNWETLRLETSLRGSWQGEVWIRRKNGEAYPAWMVMNAARDHQGAISHFIAISLDISERKANEQRIHYLAHHDVLTGLPNRFLCGDRLQLALQQAKRNNTKVALLFIDLDRFKHINDSMGHHVGDGLLVSVAKRLGGAVREGDTVSRIGGDEFIIILNAVDSVEEIGKLVEQRLIPSIQHVHEVDGAELYISCSVGVAVYPDDGTDIDTLMRNSDSAMYQAKKLGRNNAQFFTAEINERVLRHLHLESDLRHVIERHELRLHYQPRIHAGTGRLAGVESLVRWMHPTEGLILPARFIPVAEESGLILPIGAWVIREACRQHLAWRETGMGEIPISINLSALQLKEDKLLPLLPLLAEMVGEFSLSPGQIELELTESVLMENVTDTISRLHQIKKLGYLISIDDFGTGYSSLNYLYQFPIDKLKIDQSFIQNIHSTPHNLAITKAIIGLGHTLGLSVVAEGVEHAEDVILLQSAGCDELQGFHFGRPMPPATFDEWMAAHETAGAA